MARLWTLKINLIITLPRLSIKYPVPAGHLMVSLARLLASQVYIPASLKSRFKSENTCPFFQSLFSLGFRSVKTANGWRLCRRDTETSSSLVEQSITSFWPMYPFKTFCGCFAKARGSKRSKAQFRIRYESPNNTNVDLTAYSFIRFKHKWDVTSKLLQLEEQRGTSNFQRTKILTVNTHSTFVPCRTKELGNFYRAK